MVQSATQPQQGSVSLVTNERLRSLIAEAVRAPSGDNMQPWRFRLDESDSTVDIILDPNRDPSPMNAGQSMSRIACGAAAENLVQAAAHHGWGVEVVDPPADAVMKLVIRENGAGSAFSPEVMKNRASNRRFYSGEPVSDQVAVRLGASTSDLEGVRTIWSTERERVVACGKLDARATALMYIQPAMRNAIADNIRFDAPPEEEVEEGLSLASLELGAIERVAMKWMFRSPNWVLRFGGGLAGLAAHVRRLHYTASGHCLIVAPDFSERSDLLVGRAMERAWLALTAEGLAAQPMMSIMVLDGVREHGCPQMLETIGKGKIEAFLAQLREVMPEMGSDRPAFLLRFGHAPAPSGRTGRLPLEAVLEK